MNTFEKLAVASLAIEAASKVGSTVEITEGGVAVYPPEPEPKIEVSFQHFDLDSLMGGCECGCGEEPDPEAQDGNQAMPVPEDDEVDFEEPLMTCHVGEEEVEVTFIPQGIDLTRFIQLPGNNGMFIATDREEIGKLAVSLLCLVEELADLAYATGAADGGFRAMIEEIVKE